MGYRNPPASGSFKPGQSGNPRGRPKGRHRHPPHEAILGRIVTVIEDGQEMRRTAGEAYALLLLREGLGGNADSARQALRDMDEVRSFGGLRSMEQPFMIRVQLVAPGSVSTALEPLRMGRRQDPLGLEPKMMIEPWLVQRALTRLGDRRLSPEQQAVVVRSVRTPGRVRWPDWWSVRS